MSLLAMSFGDRFCVSTKGGTGGGGWVHLQGANSMVASGIGLVDTSWPIQSVHFCHKPPHFVRLPFPIFSACFQVHQVGIPREP